MNMSLPENVALAPGFPENYPVLQIETEDSSAKIALHGAHVLEWSPKGESPVLYLSPDAIYRDGKAIRGGIPICWPWFGKHPSDPDQSSHGFARNRFWDLVDEESSAAKLTFQLVTECLSARLVVEIGKTLALNLTTTNESDVPQPLSQALHTYFAVDRIGNTRVHGLEDKTYLNDLTSPPSEQTQIGPIMFEEEVDRIYESDLDSTVVLEDGTRRIMIQSSGSQSTVVWNPWIEKAASMADLPDTAYQDYVCVETCNAWKDSRILALGETHRLTTTIAVQRSLDR